MNNLEKEIKEDFEYRSRCQQKSITENIEFSYSGIYQMDELSLTRGDDFTGYFPTENRELPWP